MKKNSKKIQKKNLYSIFFLFLVFFCIQYWKKKREIKKKEEKNVSEVKKKVIEIHFEFVKHCLLPEVLKIHF